jgi:hypothetical protein
MRISNEHKTIFKKILTDAGLQLTQFDISGENEVFYIKFKQDYFDFKIEMANSSKYTCTLRTINDLNPRSYDRGWVDMLNLLKGWASQIARDIEHSPTDIQPHEEDFPSIIKKHCKKFITIYNQALTAEKNELNEICGLGYRKSFEFLIKDYLLKKHPKTEHEKIKNLPIGQCISNYVTSDEIKLLSLRVIWLGNDHAHYIKIWKQKSHADLKALIKLTIRWIENHEALLKVQRSMPDRKKLKKH